MEFESVQEVAKRLKVSVRAVQKWAKEGKLPGSKKVGRDWLVPFGAIPVSKHKENELKESKNIPSLLMNTPFIVGEAKDFIDGIENEDFRILAQAEYHFFKGDTEEASLLAEPYLNSEHFILRYIAAIYCSFANLSRGHYHIARFAMDIIQEDIYQDVEDNATKEMHALGAFAAATGSILLHVPMPSIKSLKEYFTYLPKGMKLFTCYLIARDAIMKEDYHRAIGICETALLIPEDTYPIPLIYLHIISAVAFIHLQHVEEAEEHLLKAFHYAKEDEFYQIFGEHYMLLQGLVERVFKKDYPDAFDKIIKIAKNFGQGWIKLHNEAMNATLADNLTLTEFTIAMLFNRNWRVKEIAYHMNMSERMVKTHLSIVYEKLNITSRKELHQYMLS